MIQSSFFAYMIYLLFMSTHAVSRLKDMALACQSVDDVPGMDFVVRLSSFSGLLTVIKCHLKTKQRLLEALNGETNFNLRGAPNGELN